MNAEATDDDRSETVEENAAELNYITATSLADKDYAIAEANARAQHIALLADAVADQVMLSSDALAAAIDELAQNAPSPWSIRDADVSLASAELLELAAPALAELTTAEADAGRDYDVALASAKQIHTVQTETASSIYRLALSEAEKERGTIEAAVESSAANAFPIDTLVPIRSQLATSLSTGSLAGASASTSSANANRQEKNPTAPTVPVQSTTIPSHAPAGAPTPSGTINLPLPGQETQLPSSFFGRGGPSTPLSSVLATNEQALRSKSLEMFVAPSVVQAMPLPTGTAVAYLDGKPLSLPEGFKVDPYWTPDDIKRIGQQLAVGNTAGPYTAEQLLAIQKWTDLVNFEYQKVMNQGSQRDALIAELERLTQNDFSDGKLSFADILAGKVPSYYGHLTFDELKAMVQSRLPPGADVDAWLGDPNYLENQAKLASKLGLDDESAEAKNLVLDLVQLALDIGGIFEPTPFLDIGSAAISFYRLQIFDGLVNVVSVVPYAGDMAKLAKIPKYVGTVGTVAAVVAKNPKIAGLVTDLLKQVSEILSKVELKSLPEWARQPLLNLRDAVKKALDYLAGVPTKASAPDAVEDNLPILVFDTSTHRELADNIRNAQQAGHPQILTHGGNAELNRLASLENIPNIKGLSRDEYPFASSIEGGAGAWVGHVPPAQQSSQGGIMSNFFRRYRIKPGDRYRVIVK